MKVLSGVIMIFGVLIGITILSVAESAPQEAVAVFFPVTSYVLGRALENFSTPFVKIKENSIKLENKPETNKY